MICLLNLRRTLRLATATLNPEISRAQSFKVADHRLKETLDLQQLSGKYPSSSGSFAD